MTLQAPGPQDLARKLPGGAADLHRRARIEDTAGPRESACTR